jgi:hypothetical protein
VPASAPNLLGPVPLEVLSFVVDIKAQTWLEPQISEIWSPRMPWAGSIELKVHLDWAFLVELLLRSFWGAP